LTNLNGLVGGVQRRVGPRLEALLSSQYYLRKWRRAAPFFMDQPRAWRYVRNARHTSANQWNPASSAVPPKSLWTGYGESADEYLASGRRDVATMLDMLRAADYIPQRGESVLDFGCHAGRMLRWMPVEDGITYWGVDTDGAIIRYCEESFPSPPFNFAVTTEVPHIPFVDGEFSLIIAGSVFTHIDDLALAWLLELRRVLKVGGYLYMTIHDEATIDYLRAPGADSWLANYLRTIKAFEKSSLDEAAMFTLGRGRDSQVFHRREWLVRRFAGLFELESTREGAYGCFKDPYQTGLLFRRL
jgi:SAM-dependent methyltransferase